MADSIFDNVYNPDVLSCLANLSSDEVFTPPSVANAMLDMLPQELFSNPDTKFLDPACKSGVFLREIAKRLIDGLEHRFPDLNERIEHIFKHQLYGIAITELTSLISRRSLYCSAYPNSEYSVIRFDNSEGNIRFRRLNHSWRDGKCVFCGAAQSQYSRSDELETHAYEFIHYLKPEEILNMKFDVIISNPPYQLSDGGAQASAMPIYNYFVEKAKKMNPNYLIMIIPARWYSGGKNLDEFRDQMLNDRHIFEINDYWNASDCFPGVEIKGGICYFLWNRNYNGDCTIITHDKDTIVSKMQRPLLIPGTDVFIRQNESVSILEKILSQKQTSFSSVVKSAMTFGFRTFFKNFDSESSKDGFIKVYANHSQGYIKKDKILKGTEYIDKWKVYVPEAVGSGDSRTDIFKPILGEPNSICTETYVMNGPWSTEAEARNVCKYIKTKFFHFTIGLIKNTQHTTNKVYQFVPMQKFSDNSDINWDCNITEIDTQLYKKYNLTDEEISFIESMIKPMDLGGDNNA